MPQGDPRDFCQKATPEYWSEPNGTAVKPLLVSPFNLSPTGVHRDEGKPRMDLLPGDALIEVAKAMSPGIGFDLDKYPSRNWELGLKWGDLFGSAQRHLWQWHMRQGVNDSELTHLAHATACCLMLLASELRQIGEDDRPKLK